MKHSNQIQRSVSSVLALALLALCVISLSACGDSDATGDTSAIAAVKAMKFDADPSYTIGQAFGHRKVCDSVKWDTLVDERSRNLVEYRCSFKGVKEYDAQNDANDASPIASIDELFQWSVDADGTPTLAYVGREATHENGQVNGSPMQLATVEQIIATDDVQSVVAYNNEYFQVFRPGN